MSFLRMRAGYVCVFIYLFSIVQSGTSIFMSFEMLKSNMFPVHVIFV